MKKRIFRSMCALSAVVIAVVSAVLLFYTYGLMRQRMETELKTAAQLAAAGLAAGDAESWFDSRSLPAGDVRLTLVDAYGQVKRDTEADPAAMENHADRSEIAQAMAEGSGRSRRFSATLEKETFYYALRLPDRSILRVSKTAESLLGVFKKTLPFLLFAAVGIFLLSNLTASRLTRRIVRPLSGINLDGELPGEAYDELAPFLRTILHQRRQIEAQLQSLEKSALTMKTIADGMQEGLLLLDAGGLVVTANPAAGALFNMPPEQCAGKSVLQLSRDIALLDCVRTALAGTRCDTELHFGSRTFHAFINPVARGGAIVLFLDITQRADAERMRREFSANVSHELKTPLTTILGLSELIDSGMAKPEDVAGFAGKIRQEVTRLIDLVEDIIRLSELDEGAGNRNFETFDLRKLADETAESLRPPAEEGQVSLSAEGAHFEISANRRMIGELLYNLADNAVKYNRPGGSAVLRVEKSGDRAIIEVRDTGIGIPAEHLDRIFERFYRVDKSRSKRTGGTGLGLSIVKHVAAFHGGRTSIESEEGKGTTVRVEI